MNNALTVTTAQSQDLVSEALSDSFSLSTLGIARFRMSALSLFRNSGHKESQSISIGGSNLLITIDQSLPLFDDGELLVSGLFHTVEHQLAVFQVDIFANELEFFVRNLIVMDISLIQFVTSTHEIGRGQFVTDGFVGASFSNVSVLETCGGSEVVPFFSGEGINGLLFASLLTSL